MVAFKSMNIAFLNHGSSKLAPWVHNKPRDAGPAALQAVQGVQNWKRTGRRLVEIRGRLPTVNALLTAFAKILSKHLAANKKTSLASQQKSPMVPVRIQVQQKWWTS